jgi:hypothetical protein
MADQWSSAVSGVSSLQAALYAGVLESEGIKVVTSDDTSSPAVFNFANLPQEILVPTADLEKARQIVADWDRATPASEDEE